MKNNLTFIDKVITFLFCIWLVTMITIGVVVLITPEIPKVIETDIPMGRVV